MTIEQLLNLFDQLDDLKHRIASIENNEGEWKQLERLRSIRDDILKLELSKDEPEGEGV